MNKTTSELEEKKKELLSQVHELQEQANKLQSQLTNQEEESNTQVRLVQGCIASLLTFRS